MAARIPIIAIVGRPNVGKSTLFNRMLRERKAVVEDIPGVTRDWNYGFVEHYSIPFITVDTGGFEIDPKEELYEFVVEQTKLAIEEADAIVVLFDGNMGLQPGDQDVVELLRKESKPVHYLVNKCDGVEQVQKLAEFYELGVYELGSVSALHGQGVGTMVEEVLQGLPNYEALRQAELDAEDARVKLEEEARVLAEKVSEEEVAEQERQEPVSVPPRSSKDEVQEEEEDELPPDFPPVYVPGKDSMSEQDYDRMYKVSDRMETHYYGDELLGDKEDDDILPPMEEVLPEVNCIKVAIVGRPNVGKSTLLNTLSGEQRAITSDISGTTRDVLDLELTRDGQKYIMIDTAGLRKKARIADKIERFSTMRALRALVECDVAVIVIDANAGPTEQDTKVLGLAHDQGRGIVIVVNKWDTIEKTHKTVREYTKDIRHEFKFAPYAPIVFISALSGKRCPKVIEAVKEVAVQRMRRIQTRRLNQVLRRSLRKFSLPTYRGRAVKLYYATQVDSAPPRFSLFFNYPRAVHFSSLRFLKNSIRNEFGFEGTDVKLMARKR